jgi:hypothetical protein
MGISARSGLPIRRLYTSPIYMEHRREHPASRELPLDLKECSTTIVQNSSRRQIPEGVIVPPGTAAS